MGKGIVKLGEGNWAVKDGNLLAAKETNGRFKNAEFTVTRGTDATYVGKDGLIKTASFYNLVTYSEDFSQWTGLVALSIGLNQGISPNGLTEANLLSIGIDSSSTRHRLYNLFDFVSGDTYTYSIFAKKNENDWFQLMFSASAFDAESYANFDLNNGVVGNKGTSTTANITYYGNGWYRCSITCTASTSVTTTYELLTTNNTNSGRYPSYQSSAAVNVCFLWGAQLVEGTEALDYQYTNGKEGIPRIDFTDNIDGHLLLEPQSTNLVTYSEDFSQWSANNATITQNALTSPDGTVNADKIIAISTIAQHRVDFTSSNAIGSTSFSFFAKSAEYNSCWGRIGLDSGFFDLENGLTSANVGITSNIVDYGNGWYKCTITKASSSANEVCRINITTSYTTTADFLGDNTSGIYVYGAQHEELSYPTSYIPTNGSTVTRDADTCTGAGEAADFNGSEGVLYAEINPIAVKSNSGYIGLLGASTAHRVILGLPANSNDVTYFVVSGTTIANQSYDIGDMNQYLKIALKYKQDDFALWVNGTEVLTDTSGTPDVDITHLGFYGYTTNQPFYGKVKAIRAYKEALSDSELTTLTS